MSPRDQLVGILGSRYIAVRTLTALREPVWGIMKMTFYILMIKMGTTCPILENVKHASRKSPTSTTRNESGDESAVMNCYFGLVTYLASGERVD